ncbi:MAG: uracil-DNA glycosylase, partial [Psychroflexus salarius]
PYHGKNQAHGLAFSVPEGIKIPPSLQNIFRELKTDIKDFKIPNHGNLNHWAKQGVLLLNATLTVRENKAGRHQNKGWEVFTDSVIKKLSTEKEQLVFLLWGGFAKRKAKLINANQHLILTSGHPSPLSANRGYWFGNRHFSTTNSYLDSHQKQTIKW